MLHYHGTPLTPRSALMTMAGEHFCVSFWTPTDLEVCLRIGQSVMLDNGAFSSFTRSVPFDVAGFTEWAGKHIGHPHWAVIPDVIDGPVEQQRAMLKAWPHPKELLGTDGKSALARLGDDGKKSDFYGLKMTSGLFQPIESIQVTFPDGETYDFPRSNLLAFAAK